MENLLLNLIMRKVQHIGLLRIHAEMLKAHCIFSGTAVHIPPALFKLKRHKMDTIDGIAIIMGLVFIACTIYGNLKG